MNEVQTFEVNGKTYEIRYTIAQIKLYEGLHEGRSIMATFAASGAIPSLQELIDLAACGLMVQGGGFVGIKQAREMTENLLQENGYTALLEAVLTAIERDCGFFFKVAAKG